MSLVPLAEVLPWPDPGPRPTRLRGFRAPRGGRRSLELHADLLRLLGAAARPGRRRVVRRFDPEGVRDLRDHAPDGGRVLVHDRRPDAAEAERLDRRPWLGLRPIGLSIRVTLSFLLGTAGLLRFLQAPSAQPLQILELPDAPERVHGRLQHVVRVVACPGSW